jgi:hypothetical protein
MATTESRLKKLEAALNPPECNCPPLAYFLKDPTINPQTPGWICIAGCTKDSREWSCPQHGLQRREIMRIHPDCPIWRL